MNAAERVPRTVFPDPVGIDTAASGSRDRKLAKSVSLRPRQYDVRYGLGTRIDQHLSRRIKMLGKGENAERIKSGHTDGFQSIRAPLEQLHPIRDLCYGVSGRAEDDGIGICLL